MCKMWSIITAAAFLLPLIRAAPTFDKHAQAPTVQMSYGRVIGSSFRGIDSFKGIPYAQPPVGELRLKPPQPITAKLGTIQATGVPRACPQLYKPPATDSLPPVSIDALVRTPLIQNITFAGEDCLTINVQRPSSAKRDSKLPVVFWMHGGAFQFGSTQMYDGSEFIRASVAQQKDIIYVAVNYRVGGFGFLAGKEILKDGSANLGHLDQRLGLKWVADNIAQFGGDPRKVTIWGESAGSVSVFNQMVLYDGDNLYKGMPLFRAGIMNSGSLTPADPVDAPQAQTTYDKIVNATGCSTSLDTLACLRKVDYITLLTATTDFPGTFDYEAVALPYLPRPDGKVITASGEILAFEGRFADVPFIIGNQEDEGTVFALRQTNLTTTKEVVSYFQNNLFRRAPLEKVEQLVAAYPDDPVAGSPFNTGTAHNIYPQYKRIAAIIGDLTFTLSRRSLLTAASASKPNLPSWSFYSSYDKHIPILGTFHATDVSATYGLRPSLAGATIQKYYFSFFHTTDPNNGTRGEREWPQWKQDEQQLHFETRGTSLLKDNYREKQAAAIVAGGDAFRS